VDNGVLLISNNKIESGITAENYLKMTHSRCVDSRIKYYKIFGLNITIYFSRKSAMCLGYNV